jgi:NTP pyrophosphatase (non-canonical NTP hydrolase)
MKMNKYQRLCELTQGDHEDFHMELLNVALGAAGEAGEIADLVKKHVFHGHDFAPEKLIEEAGDNLFYLSWLASALNVTLDYIAEQNIAKLQRRYPDGFSYEASRNRDESKVEATAYWVAVSHDGDLELWSTKPTWSGTWMSSNSDTNGFVRFVSYAGLRGLIPGSHEPGELFKVELPDE